MTQCDLRVTRVVSLRCICNILSWLLTFPFISTWKVITFRYIDCLKNDPIGDVIRQMALSLLLCKKFRAGEFKVLQQDKTGLLGRGESVYSAETGACVFRKILSQKNTSSKVCDLRRLCNKISVEHHISSVVEDVEKFGCHGALGFPSVLLDLRGLWAETLTGSSPSQ